MTDKIQKRDGKVVSFDLEKIAAAIWGAAKSVGGKDSKMSQDLAKKVLYYLDQKYSARDLVTVEIIQDFVEKTLIKERHYTTAKAFIIYRDRRHQARENKNLAVTVESTISEYLNRLDWRVNANSNQGYSIGGMILNTSGKVTANYWLSHVYPRKIGEAHRTGDLHIHDLDMFSGYCAGWSLRVLLEEGFNGVPDKTESLPPKHLSTAVSQMVNFLGTLQNEWAGAQAFSSFDTYLSPFIKIQELKIEQDLKDLKVKFKNVAAKKAYIYKKTFAYTKQNLQSFVFNLNVPSRWGTQTPFTNVTLDWVCPEDLKNKRLKVGGKDFEFTFGELQNEMDIVNKAFIEVMTAGDAKGRVFTFPIPTYNITKDFNWDHPAVDSLFEMTAKYGIPYFQNFLNSDLEPHHVRSMCCRLQLDLKELLKRGGGLFGSAEMTGSIGIVTLPLARVGYMFKQDKKGFLERIEYLMELSKTSLEIKRKEIQKWIDLGLFPFTKRYLGSLDNHFSTIGINGMNEAIRNFTNDKHDITDQWGIDFAMEVMTFMREKLTEFQSETGNLYNLEATPAEGTTYRFARADKAQFTDIIQAGTKDAPYYTNSTQLPVEYTADAFEALSMQDELQTKYTGGTVLHLYMGERVSSSKVCANLVRKALSQFRLPYITITPTFSICPKHGYIAGEHDFCPRCDSEMGYSKPEKEDTKFREKFDARRRYRARTVKPERAKVLS